MSGVGITRRIRLWEAHGGRCGICSRPVALEEMHIDHIVPRSRGGLDVTDNMHPSHPLCNHRKGTQALKDVSLDEVRLFQLRIPKGVHDALMIQAGAEGRSLNGQIVYLLRIATSQPDPKVRRAKRRAAQRGQEG